MTRTTIAGALLALLLLAAPARAGEREQLNERIAALDARIAEIDAQIAKVMEQRKITDVDKSVLEESGVPAFAKDLRDRYDKLRAPLDAMDAELQNLQDQYDKMLDEGYEIDLWGAIEPRGTFGDQMRELYRTIAAKRKARAEKEKELDAVVAKDEDTSTYKTVSGFGQAVDRAWRTHLDTKVEGHLELKRLMVEKGRLERERARLRGLIEALRGLVVVWTNDVGWVHVGSKESFQNPGPRGGEIWGGLGGEPLVHAQALGGREFKSQTDAIKALGEALGTVEKKHTPLASPNDWYEGQLDGKKVMIGFEIVQDPEFKPFLPK
jgi:hypothetical protein